MEVITDQVALNTFAPVDRIHYGDLVFAALLSFFLLTNIFHMYVLTLRKDVNIKVPLSIYITEAWQL